MTAETQSKIHKEFKLFQRIFVDEFNNNPFDMLPALATFFTFVVRSLYNIEDPKAQQAARNFTEVMRKSLETCLEPWPEKPPEETTTEQGIN